jgi:hypothetical protein
VNSSPAHAHRERVSFSTVFQLPNASFISDLFFFQFP